MSLRKRIKLEQQEEEIKKKVSGSFKTTDFDSDGVLGNGKGGIYPEYEFESMYNFIIPEPGSSNPTPWTQNPSEPPNHIQPNILSVVASATLGEKLDLKSIADIATNLSYNVNSFTPLVMRLREPVATAMVFKSGKMVVTGTQSVEECHLAVKKFVAAIRAAGYKSVKPFGLRIQNITASVNVGFKVRVHNLGKDKMLSPHTSYEPTHFTGVEIALPVPKSKIMVFRTGSMLITGVRTEADLAEVFRIVYSLVKMYST